MTDPNAPLHTDWSAVHEQLHALLVIHKPELESNPAAAFAQWKEAIERIRYDRDRYYAEVLRERRFRDELERGQVQALTKLADEIMRLKQKIIELSATSQTPDSAPPTP